LGFVETQTVSLAFSPHHINWNASGDMEGTGSHVYSNRVSGKFSVSGGGDYYETNVSAAFVPEGKATGSIRASFRFNNWY
jgi:hypothetical protein